MLLLTVILVDVISCFLMETSDNFNQIDFMLELARISWYHNSTFRTNCVIRRHPIEEGLFFSPF